MQRTHPELLEMRRMSDPRQHEDVRRADRSGRQHDLLPRSDCHQRAIFQVLNSDSSLSIEDDLDQRKDGAVEATTGGCDHICSRQKFQITCSDPNWNFRQNDFQVVETLFLKFTCFAIRIFTMSRQASVKRHPPWSRARWSGCAGWACPGKARGRRKTTKISRRL